MVRFRMGESVKALRCIQEAFDLSLKDETSHYDYDKVTEDMYDVIDGYVENC